MTQRRWLSQNDDKAWAERFFLAYSPVWMAAVAIVIGTGWIDAWGDASYMCFGLATMAPFVVVPWVKRSGRGTPFYETYWFKLNVWIAIFVFAGTYFYTHYFFDVMGMGYAFPVTWTLDAAIGESEQRVPLFLYPLTHAYFVTYHTIMVILLRRARNVLPRSVVLDVLAVFVLAYAIAWGETAVMANEALADYFWYADRERMLWVGSLGYCLIYVCSLPLIYRVDEHTGERWSLTRVALEALAASMLGLIVLDVWAKVVGPL